MFVVHEVKDKRLQTKVKQKHERLQGERMKAVEQPQAFNCVSFLKLCLPLE